MKHALIILFGSLLSWSCATTPMQTTWIPFELKDQKIVIPTTIKRQPVKAIFDSGAGMTVIDRKLADRLNIKTAGREFVRSLAEVKYTEFASRVPFNFYGAEIEQDVAIQDLSGVGVDVMFGSSLLRGAVMEFDFPHERMRFHRLGSYQYAGPTRTIPLKRQDTRYFVDLTINGKDTRFLVDTGATGSLTMPLDRDQIKAKLANGSKQVNLHGANQEVVSAAEEQVKPFMFGSYEIKNAAVRYYDQHRGDNLEGIIGMALLKEFNVIFDTDHDAMYLEAYE